MGDDDRRQADVANIKLSRFFKVAQQDVTAVAEPWVWYVIEIFDKWTYSPEYTYIFLVAKLLYKR